MGKKEYIFLFAILGAQHSLHNLDMIHVEKNIFIIVRDFIDLKGKSKNNLKA